MLESFCPMIGHRKNSLELGSPGLYMEDEEMMETILSVEKVLATGKCNYHSMCKSLRDFVPRLILPTTLTTCIC